MNSKLENLMFPPEVKKRLEALKKPTINLQLSEQKSASKFGGLPSIETASFEWPKYDDNPLAFIGQIDLAEMSQVLKYDWLPERGVLLFFYDIIERCSGFDPSEKDSWRVIYQENPDGIAQLPNDIDVESKFQERFIVGTIEQRLPPHADHIHLPTNEYTIADKEEYNKLNWAKDAESEYDKPFHQFGGYPTDPGYHCLKIDAQLAFSGIDVYFRSDLPSLTDERIAATEVSGSCNALYASDEAMKVKAGAEDWELLLQIDTDPAVDDEFFFGDECKLYFYVQKDKASKKNFNDCWLLVERM